MKQLYTPTRPIIYICGFLAPLFGLAADYYLSTTGDDADVGSIAEPWASFTHAVGQLASGDTLYIMGGSYPQRLLLSGKTGAVLNPIAITNYEDEVVVVEGTSLTVPTNWQREGLVEIQNCDYINLNGLTVQNYITSSNSATPVGILIEGSGSGIIIENCEVTHIWQSSTNSSANGFGIAVYGTSSTAIDGFQLLDCKVHNLRTGQSESVVLNGNVTNFLVARNQVYDCNNIGIDFIGYEGSAPTAFDRTRDGSCVENLVYNIDSAFNPGYGGSFTTGGGDSSAAGIYVDGGTHIVIERNRVYNCNFGIELASENSAGFTDYIVMRNNLLHHNYGPGIIMGGYDQNRGVTRYCQVLNNTLYRNDTTLTYGGQIAFQYYLENNIFKNNIIWANESSGQMIIHYVEEGTTAQKAFDTATNLFDYNCYYFSGDAGNIEFGLNRMGNTNSSYSSLSAWQSAIGSDSNSSFNQPGFSVATPATNPSPSDFMLTSAAFCRDAGDPSFTADGDEKDYFGSSRIANAIVDIGCHEYMTNLQAWRDLYFDLPDGGGAADDGDDFDLDGVANLIEYSQSMDPTVQDAANSPNGSAVSESIYRFSYRKDAPELNYAVQTTQIFDGWPTTSITEQTNSNGLYWRDFAIAEKLFVRLRVAQ